MRRLAAGVVIALLAAASLFALDAFGKSSRVYGPAHAFGSKDMPVVSVKTSVELYSALKASGYKGRVLVHIGKYLHFVGPDMAPLYSKDVRFPVGKESALSAMEKEVDYRSVLFIAMEAGIAREIVHVLPEWDFGQRLAQAEGLEGASVENSAIITHHFGSRRTIRYSVPGMDEPPIVVIDAEYFSGILGSALWNKLKDSGLKTDMAIVCLSEDNPDVTDKDREALREFSRLYLGREI